MKVEIDVDEIRTIRAYVRSQKPSGRREKMLALLNYWLVGVPEPEPETLGIHVADGIGSQDRLR